MTPGDDGRAAIQRKRRKAQLEARRARTPAHVLASQRRKSQRTAYRRKLIRVLGYVPTLAMDTFRGFRDCLSGESL